MTEWHRAADLSAADRAAVAELSRAVYPPAEAAAWSGRSIEWAAPEWSALVRGPDGDVRSYAGALLRDAILDGRPVLVGGVGGVKTYPAARGRGLAAAVVGRAVAFFREAGADFALLVCETDLIPYYRRLGWAAFDGPPLVQQRGETVPFTFNRAMTFGIEEAAPAGGSLDLRGPPW